MCSITLVAVVSVLATALASAGNSTLDTNANTNTNADTDTCGLEPGPWAAALELWVTSDHGHHDRQGRIMALPAAKGYYVSDRMDLMPPPPPPHHNPMHPPPHHTQPGPPHHNSGPPHHNIGPQYQTQSGLHHTQAGPPQHPPGRPYEEWQVTPPPPPATSKIVNRPPNPYNDKFRPSYPVGAAGQPIPVGAGGAVDRVDEPTPTPTHKQVSETDLFLLSAIEKLVFRVDVMEKRLRKMEETVHYLVAGAHTTTKPVAEPCVSNFTRVGGSCYHFSSELQNWKGASIACRKRGATLLELDAQQEKRIFQSALLADKRLKGVDWWTGGLNPGLLWIWSHSARPVSGNDTSASTSDTSTVVGSGRCLALVHDPAGGTYVYRGQDCALNHRYVCEAPQDSKHLSNEVDRLAKMLRGRLADTIQGHA